MDTMTSAAATGSKPVPNKNSKFLRIVGMIVIILVVVIIALFIYFGKNKPAEVNNTNTTLNVIPENVSALTTKPVLEITSPTENSTVNGRFDISGKLTSSVGKVSIEVSDNTGEVLGQSDAKVDSTQKDTVLEWSVSMDIVASPKSTTGNIKITPVDKSFSYLIQNIKINFEEQDSDRVKINAPLANQLMYSNNVYFMGQMKDFSEGTMNLRLKDEEDHVIYSGTITASDNYGQFANFAQSVTVSDLASAKGKTGKWEIYDVSAMDGSETVLYSFNVRFL